MSGNWEGTKCGLSEGDWVGKHNCGFHLTRDQRTKTNVWSPLVRPLTSPISISGSFMSTPPYPYCRSASVSLFFLMNCVLRYLRRGKNRITTGKRGVEMVVNWRVQLGINPPSWLVEQEGTAGGGGGATGLRGGQRDLRKPPACHSYSACSSLDTG